MQYCIAIPVVQVIISIVIIAEYEQWRSDCAVGWWLDADGTSVDLVFQQLAPDRVGCDGADDGGKDQPANHLRHAAPVPAISIAPPSPTNAQPSVLLFMQ